MSNERIPFDISVMGKGGISRVSGEKIPAPSISKVTADMFYELLMANYQLPESTPFRKKATVTINDATNFQDIVSFTMPTGAFGVLKLVGQGANSAAAFDNLTWQLVKNSNPITDLGSFTFQLGSISSPFALTERIQAGDIVTLRAKTDNVANVWNAQGLLIGWYWGK